MIKNLILKKVGFLSAIILLSGLCAFLSVYSMNVFGLRESQKMLKIGWYVDDTYEQEGEISAIAEIEPNSGIEFVKITLRKILKTSEFIRITHVRNMSGLIHSTEENLYPEVVAILKWKIKEIEAAGKKKKEKKAKKKEKEKKVCQKMPEKYKKVIIDGFTTPVNVKNLKVNYIFNFGADLICAGAIIDPGFPGKGVTINVNKNLLTGEFSGVIYDKSKSALLSKLNETSYPEIVEDLKAKIDELEMEDKKKKEKEKKLD